MLLPCTSRLISGRGLPGDEDGRGRWCIFLCRHRVDNTAPAAACLSCCGGGAAGGGTGLRVMEADGRQLDVMSGSKRCHGH